MKYVLSHHGIKGQRWGVRNGPPYPLDSKTSSEIKKRKKPKILADPISLAISRDAKLRGYGAWAHMQNIKSGRMTQLRRHGSEYVLKSEKDWTRDTVKDDLKFEKGKRIYRITHDPEETLEGKKQLYVTANEDDRNLYRAVFSNSVLGKEAKKNRYEKEMELLKDITVASKDSQVDTIMEVTGLTRQESTLLVGKINYEIVLDETLRSKETTKFLKEIKKRGYDAVMDLNDSGWMGREPIVILDPDNSYIETKSIKKLSKHDRNRAIDKVSWNFKKHIGGNQ